MRTVNEIIEKCNSKNDMFGFTNSALLEFLTFEEAKPILKEDATSDGWGDTPPRTKESVISVMRDYMEFAWGKAKNHRGISASRSITKMRAWMWLLEEEESIDWSNYENYGAPILKAICERYNFPIPDSEILRRMASGQHCGADYDCGCGT